MRITGLRDLKIMHKLTLAYVLFIIIPLLYISYLTYSQQIENEKNDIIKKEEVTLNRINENIKYKIDIIDSISESISSNSRLIRFLKNDYNYSSYSIEEYKYFISPIFEYSKIIQKVNTHSIRIYMVGSFIEESPSIFFHESRIMDQDWYKQFLSQDKKTIWMGPNNIDFLHGIESDKKKYVYSYVRKLYAEDGTYLGVLVINIYQDELLSTIKNLAESDQALFVLNDLGKQIYPLNNEMSLLTLDEIKEMNQGQGFLLTKKNALYTFKKIASLNVFIGVKMNNTVRLTDGSTRLIIVIIVAITSLIIVFYIILNNIFRHINTQIKMMNKAIDDDFNTRIPVTRKDELGQLSKSFNALVDKINVLIRDIVIKETAQKDANLKALQYQINPHFIYNTIDIFGSKMEVSGNYEMADAITDFGKMMRYNMSDVSMLSTIKVEMGHVNSYINIEKLKYENRLHIFFDCPKDLYDLKIIKFILQPIVENSVMHGFTDKHSVLRIYVKFTVKNDYLFIEVADDGKGMVKEKMERLNRSFQYSDYTDSMFRKAHGIGLKNINERIKIFYGEECYIKLCNKDERFIKTMMRIPIE